MTTEQFASLAQTTLAAGMDGSQTSCTVLSAAVFPSSAQFRLQIDLELLLVTAGAGTTTWTVTRGIEGTSAASHASGSRVTHVLTAAAIGGQSDPAAGVPGLRSLGTGAQQAAAGNDPRLTDWIVLPASSASAAGTAINAAITTLGTNGGTIYIPKGTWTLDTAVQFNQSGICIQGASQSATLLQFDASVVPTAIKMADTTQRWGILRDFRMATTSGSTGLGTAIDGSYFTNWSIERLRVGASGQAPNKGIIFNATGSFYNAARDIRITVAGAGSVGMSFDTNSNSNQVDNARIFGDTNTTGVYVNSHAVELEHIDIESNCLVGIDVAASGHDCTVFAPYLEALPGTGLRLASGVKSTVVQGGFIADCVTANITDNGSIGSYINSRVQYNAYTAISGTRESYDTAIPASGTYSLGSKVWNLAPEAGGNVGWVCVTAGSPGTWKPFGVIGV